MDAKEFNRYFKCLAKNKDAVIPIYEYYYPRIMSHVCSHFTPSIAEEVAQTFFVKFMVYAETYNGIIERPNAWIYTCVDNIAIQLLRKDKRNMHLELDDCIGFSIDPVLDTITRLDVREMIKSMDELDQKIVYYRFWEGMDFIEIAERVGLSYDNVRQRMHRAIKKLKKSELSQW